MTRVVLAQAFFCIHYDRFACSNCHFFVEKGIDRIGRIAQPAKAAGAP